MSFCIFIALRCHIYASFHPIIRFRLAARRTLYGFAMTEKRRRLSRPLQQHHLEAATARVAARGAITPSPFVVKPVAGAHTAGKGPTTRAGLTAGKVSVSPGNPVTPARAGDIQTSLSAFRDTVIARQASSDASVPRVAEWVAAHLLGRGKPACSVEELEVVLDALKEQDAVMLTEDEARKSRTVWFV